MKLFKKPEALLLSLRQDLQIPDMHMLSAVLLTAVCLYTAFYAKRPLSSDTPDSSTTPALSSPVQNELPIYSVETEQPVVALTFDAAWGDEDLNDILSILASHQAKATFFVSGDWVDKYPDAVQAIYAAGHELANHGSNHKHMPQLSEEAMRTEIMECHQRVYALTGFHMTAFRAPYSDWSDSVVAVAKSCGYSSINQNVDSVDWKDYGVDSIIQTVMEDPDLGNGAIILLHNGSTYTRDALDELLNQLEKNGYTFDTISNLIYTTDYTIDHTGRQFLSS